MIEAHDAPCKWGVFVLGEEDEEPGSVHVMPCTDDGCPMMGHEASMECFCMPTRQVEPDPEKPVIYAHHLPY